MKRGVSNLIAIVIIIGILIAIAIAIFLWTKSFHKEVEQEVSQKAEKQLICSSDAKINIKEAKSHNDNITFLIENIGKQNIKSLKLRLYEQNDIKTDNLTIALNPYEIKKIEYNYPSSKPGTGLTYLKKVEIYPIIILKNEEVLCINNFAVKEITDKEITSCTGSSTQSCYIENGTGEQTRICNEETGIWSDWSSCQVINCNPGYTEQNNQCVPATCEAQNGDICLEQETCPGESLEATDTDYCCSETCILPSWQQCSNCGQGLFNLCDRQECESIQQQCYFISGILSGNCYPCSSSTCTSYNSDQVTCTNDICNLDNCTWVQSRDMCENIITSCQECSTLIDNQCIPNNLECPTPQTQSCTILNGQGQQQQTNCDTCTGLWQDWSTCQVISCNPGYIKQGNQCIEATCQQQNGDICQEGEICPGTELPATDTDSCCSLTCTIPIWNQCSNCGQGLFNICDRQECNSITEGCYFISGLTGSCYPCSTASECISYNGDSATCNEDHCNFNTCIWTSRNICEIQLTSCPYCQHIEDNQCIQNNYQCSNPQTRSCTIPNGQGQQTQINCDPCTGQYTSWSSCQATSCDYCYHIENNLCVQNNYECSGTPLSRSCTTPEGKPGTQYRTCNNCDGTWTGTWTECYRDCSEYDCGEPDGGGDCQPVPAGEYNLPACQRCDGISLNLVNIPTGQLDSEGSNLCEDNCNHCSNGNCLTRYWQGQGYGLSKCTAGGARISCSYSNLGIIAYGYSQSSEQCISSLYTSVTAGTSTCYPKKCLAYQ